MAPVAAVLSCLGALMLPAAAAPGIAGDTGRGGFCCWAGEDLTNVCGTCLPTAVATNSSFCSKSQAACLSCGKTTWCEDKAKKNKQISTGTDLLLSLDGDEALGEGQTVIVEIGGKVFEATVQESAMDEDGFDESLSIAPSAGRPTSAPELPTAAVDSSSPSVEAVAQHGALRVKGSKIVGEHGLPVRLRGVSMFWSQWMGQFWNAEVVRWLKEDWRVTVIRASMGVEKGGYLAHPARERARLEEVVDACIHAGIYVIIDWHDYHAESHLDEAKEFFSGMAKKYGSKPNVLFEIYNEPQQISWSRKIKPYHAEVTKAIREHSDNIVVLGTRTWSQEADVASQDPVRGENLAYTLHFYAASMGEELRAKVSAALEAGVAVFATEWGACEYTGSGKLDLQATEEWLDFLEANDISDANWAISDKDESCSALAQGASSSGGWPAADLTKSGAFVRDSIRRYNSAGGGDGGDLSEELVQEDSAAHGRLRLSGRQGGLAAPAVATLLGSACLCAALVLALAHRWRARAEHFRALRRQEILSDADQ